MRLPVDELCKSDGSQLKKKLFLRLPRVGHGILVLMVTDRCRPRNRTSCTGPRKHDF